jgi:rhodanese-related sulfurtransferase
MKAMMPKTIDELLAEARARLQRVDPRAAAAILAGGGLVVDIRPAEQRRRDGEIPGAIAVERNVLEWRLAPSSAYRIAELTGPEHEVVIVCAQGFASSLAAAALLDLGLVHATDLDGGFESWAASGLPVRRAE